MAMVNHSIHANMGGCGNATTSNLADHVRIINQEMIKQTDMTQPIIDPSTLTEEQREAIKEEYAGLEELVQKVTFDDELMAALYSQKTLMWLFGKDFFKKGE